MRLHQENIFRYLLACFIVAVFGLVMTWTHAENEHQLNMAKTEASLIPDEVPTDRAVPDRATSSEHQ